MTRFGGNFSSIGVIPVLKSALHGCPRRRSVSAKSPGSSRLTLYADDVARAGGRRCCDGLEVQMPEQAEA